MKNGGQKKEGAKKKEIKKERALYRRMLPTIRLLADGEGVKCESERETHPNNSHLVNYS